MQAENTRKGFLFYHFTNGKEHKGKLIAQGAMLAVPTVFLCSHENIKSRNIAVKITKFKW